MNKEHEDLVPDTAKDSSEQNKEDLYTDSDILKHSQALVRQKLEEARGNDFKVEIDYTDLRLLADSISIAISRTAQVNQIAEALNKRMEMIRSHTQHIQNIAAVKLKNEEN